MSSPGKGPGPGEREPSERAAQVRKGAIAARETALTARESGMEARETAASTRELSLAEREELARLRDDTLRAREQAAAAVAAQTRLIKQMREANEKLVLATVRAEELAAQADAARLEVAVSEERFRSLVTTSAAVVWYANAEGRIAVDPDSWRTFTGLDANPQEEEPGWLLAVHPDDRDRVRETWREATAAKTVYSQQHRLRRPDGTYAWVVSRAVPIPRTGAVREWIGMMTDISDRMLVEEARERFIGILGHDLRNPLSAIVTGVEVLANADPPAPVARTIERIRRSASRMDAMIRDVLDFARGRLGGGIPIRPERCDLGRIASEEVDEMKQASPGRVIELEVMGDLSGDWDVDRVEQLLSNLIGNAVRHGSDPIRIAARNAGDHVIVTVHNRGRPIPAPMLPCLFEPFQQGVSPEGSAGLGLGLYIAREIVHAHRGTIQVSSTEALGTTFTIELPRFAP
jgi:PAS domain S-box-containing protein